VAYNFNQGLQRAKGEYCKFVTEDDYLPVDGLKHLAQGIQDYPWIFANALQVDDNQWIYKPPAEATQFEVNVRENKIRGGTTLYRTDILREIGGMDERLWTGEEYEMHLRLFSLGYNPGYIDKVVYCHRLWSGQKSKQLRKNKSYERKEEIKRIQSLYNDKV
jgi:glycosyltransferase involved in cell wall biosynthesis